LDVRILFAIYFSRYLPFVCDTTGNAAFAVHLNFCRASFIGRTAKSFFVVRHTKRTVTNLCRSSYFMAHGKESLPCVLNTDARQRIFFLPPLFATNGR
jgi:hypothetical protein